jgi:nucleoside-diphosphate-sugar epimerase
MRAMSKPIVLLTGAGGRIGPHLLPSFQERYDLRVLDRQPIAGVENITLTDLQDPDALRQALAGVETVVHLAATSDEAPFLEKLVPNNVVGLYNILQASVDAGVRRFIFASTVQTVRAWEMTQPVRTADPPRPVSLYGATKVFGETIGRYYHDRHGLEFIAVRIGWFQDYDSPVLKKPGGGVNIWLSPRDCARLLHLAVEKPDIGYAVVFGTSKTPVEVLSLQEAREVLGYEPEDDPSDYAEPQSPGG